MIKGVKINDEQISVKDFIKEVPNSLEEEVMDLLKNHDVKLDNPIEATVHKKSDV